MIDLTPHERGTALRVGARPNARKDAILGERAGSWRVGVTAAPEKGKANLAIAEVLADGLGCRSSGLILLPGVAAREKRFLALGLDEEALRARLAAPIPDPK